MSEVVSRIPFERGSAKYKDDWHLSQEEQVRSLILRFLLNASANSDFGSVSIEYIGLCIVFIFRFAFDDFRTLMMTARGELSIHKLLSTSKMANLSASVSASTSLKNVNSNTLRRPSTTSPFCRVGSHVTI